MRASAACQYTSIRYTEHLAEAGIAPSIGSAGDAYDNAMAESTIGLYKAELIYRQGHGARESKSRSPRSNTSTGGTTDGCTQRSETFRLRRRRRYITLKHKC